MKTLELTIKGRGDGDVERFPITQGIPFPNKTLPTSANLILADDNGREVPLQTQVLATWSPRRLWVKWLLLDFAISLKAGEERRLTLKHADGSVTAKC